MGRNRSELKQAAVRWARHARAASAQARSRARRALRRLGSTAPSFPLAANGRDRAPAEDGRDARRAPAGAPRSRTDHRHTARPPATESRRQQRGLDRQGRQRDPLPGRQPPAQYVRCGGVRREEGRGREVRTGHPWTQQQSNKRCNEEGRRARPYVRRHRTPSVLPQRPWE